MLTASGLHFINSLETWDFSWLEHQPVWYFIKYSEIHLAVSITTNGGFSGETLIQDWLPNYALFVQGKGQTVFDVTDKP